MAIGVGHFNVAPETGSAPGRIVLWDCFGILLIFISYYDVPREIGCKFVPLKQSHRTLERSHCVI